MRVPPGHGLGATFWNPMNPTHPPGPVMRAYVLTAPGEGAVQEVPRPEAGAGEVVVDVERVGLCGTDVEFWTGEMSYLADGHARYPMRLGHEWCGTVATVGA